MYTRICIKCNVEQSLDYFEKNRAQCNSCVSKRKRVYRERNKEHIRQVRLEYLKDNKKKAYNSTRIRSNIRYKNDINFRLKVILRSRIRKALKKEWKSGSAVKDLGCSIDFLKKHLESKFKSNMSWQNYGNSFGKWNIDHIKPLALFDLTNRKEFLEACNYQNLQPLWFEDNNKKRDKLSL